MTAARLIVRPIDDDAFVDIAGTWAAHLPIEQSPLWDRFDATVDGRDPWRRLVVAREEGPALAIISLTRYQGRGFAFLWAKHGPVWAERPDAHTELALRDALAAYVRAEAPWAPFVRLHAWHRAPDLHDLLQTVTYDRTVTIDLTVSDEARMAALSKSTRKKLRRTLEDDAVVIADETDRAADDFGKYYAILEETAERDGFGVFGPQVYQGMIRALAPAARVIVARRTDTGPEGEPPGRAVSWILFTVYDGAGVNFYSGQTAEGRATNIGVRLRWELMSRLRAEGVVTYDLMGVDSERAPQLRGVGAFKRQFGPEVEVDGAWDLPLRTWRYRALTLALRAKRALRL